MKNRKLRICAYLLALINLTAAAVLYPALPDQIPMHWGADGTVGFNDKYQLFFLCGMSLLLAFMLDMLPKIDPRRKNYQKFGVYYDGFCVLIQLFMLAMTGIILTEAFRPGTVSVPVITMICVGILLLFTGNIMPKIRSNFYIGIKTPWSLSSEEVWRRTHRLGGKCFFLAGIVMIVCAFLPSQEFAFWGAFLFTMAACLLPGIMSYIWWKNDRGK